MVKGGVAFKMGFAAPGGAESLSAQAPALPAFERGAPFTKLNRGVAAVRSALLKRSRAVDRLSICSI